MKHSEAIAEALYRANGPRTHTELLIDAQRKVPSESARQNLKRWVAAGLVRKVYVHREPETDVPGAWPNARRLRCYEFTEAGRLLYEHYSKLSKKPRGLLI